MMLTLYLLLEPYFEQYLMSFLIQHFVNCFGTPDNNITILGRKQF